MTHNLRYENYHKHDHSGNPWMQDSIAKAEDYAKRAVELGHKCIFTTNHGIQGDKFQFIEAAKKYDLKVVHGTELYYVPNRFEDDRSNKHIVIIAKNDDGVLQLNELISEAHITGFYYRPRIDDELLFELDPDNFIITSACVAGIWNNPELIMKLHQKFGNNFYLEVQNHNLDFQKEVNRTVLELSRNSGIKIIHGNDSHYIYKDDAKYRDIYMNGKSIGMNDGERGAENNMILDYPSSEIIFDRYKQQGVLTEEEVFCAMQNTLVFDDCEPITIYNDEIKLPSISKNPKKDFKDIINKEWKKQHSEIPTDERKDHIEGLRYEGDIIDKTNMEDYFIIDYRVAEVAQTKYNGRLTNTGRGSAPSFYTNKMLGLTDIDRITSPITLFPTRFMSVERILGARSLPDIDLNTTDRVPFIKATEDLLGAENCAWMIAWKPLQDASAFRLYCKGIGMHISEYDDVAKDLDFYREGKKWKDIIEESKRFIGVIHSISESPCSMLLYDKPVKREIGLVRLKDAKNNVKYCCLLDGYNCDKYKYLKNDYLTVTVWAIIREVCELAGIPIPTIKEINELLDDKTYKIYEDGLTCTINQVDSDYATGLAKRYKPQNVSEMSAFVAILRPGCASLLEDFINRKPYTTGVKELDDILEDSGHRLIYQESLMKYFIWLGVPETSSYDIIKKISKKKFKEKELEELKKQLADGWIKQVGKIDGFEETWIVVEQAAHYSFNASHSLSYAYDSLYGAYLKSHYPLEYYTVALNAYEDDRDRTTKLTKELEYFGIEIKPIKFRYSQSGYSADKETNSIYKGIKSVKELNAMTADALYELRNNHYDSFVDLLFDCHNHPQIQKAKIEILIKLNFFSEFGEINQLLAINEMFQSFVDKKQYKKEKLAKYNIPESAIREIAPRETKTMFADISNRDFINIAAKYQNPPQRKICEIVKDQTDYLGYITLKDKRYANMAGVLDVDTKYTPRCVMYSLKNGTNVDCKIGKAVYKRNPFEKGALIKIEKTERKQRMKRLGDGEYEPIPNAMDLWIKKYKILDI